MSPDSWMLVHLVAVAVLLRANLARTLAWTAATGVAAVLLA